MNGPSAGTVFPLISERTLIGRLDSTQLALVESTVSRVHAQVLLESTGVWVEDLQSLQGTWVNGVAVRRQLLKQGDRIAIGDVILEFRCG